MKHIFTLLILIATWISSPAQETVVLSGKISTTNMDPIPGATVRVLNTAQGAATNEAGEFSITNLLPAKYTLEISAVGYASVKKSVDLTASAEILRIQLVESVRQLDAVIVTAEKKEDDIQKIPSSITNISSRQVEQYRLWNAKDITAISPNLYSANPGDNRNVTSIRGITSTSYDPAVATYIDGVNQFNLDTYISPIFDIERIEVLRGPQGTLYGRNAMGGVINIITKEPTNSTHGFAEISMGDYGQQRYSLGVRTPLIDNKLFLGVAGIYDKADGFYTNTFNNQSFDKKHSVTGNYFLKYLVTPQWSITANVKHHSNRNDGAFALALSPDDAFAKPFEVEQNALTTLIDNTINASLNVQHTGRRINFTSLTTYQANHRYYDDPIDSDFSQVDFLVIVNNYGKKWNNVKAWTQEFKFTSAPSASPFSWTAGTYMFTQNSPTKQSTLFGEATGDAAGLSEVNITKATSRGIAFYGQANYALGEHLIFTLGARFDHEQKEQRGVVGEFLPPGAPFTDEILDSAPDSTASYNAFTPKIGLTYSVSEDHHFYATYTRGYRAGGFTQLPPSPGQPAMYKYKPEYSNNVEVGLKNSFVHNRLRVNISAFLSKVVDSQVPTLIIPQAITATQNAGKLTSKGVEFELSATPSKGVQVEYMFGYTDARFDRLRVPNQGTEDPFDEINMEGNRQLFTPEFTSMLAAQFTPQIAEWQSLKLMVRGESLYLGNQYFDLANNIRQKAYNVLNARAGVIGDNFELTFWIRNITDKKYISYAYDFGGTHLGDPQNMGFTLRGMF